MADEEVKVTCPECGHDVGTKEGGTKIKVHKVAGVRCDGSESDVPSPDADADGIDKGQSYEPLDGAQDDDWDDDDSTDPETPTEPETGTQGVASSETPEYVHTIRVHGLCPYLEDQAWQAENSKMAAIAAQQAGHVLAGGEAKAARTEPDGDFLLIHYSVPVK